MSEHQLKKYDTNDLLESGYHNQSLVCEGCKRVIIDKGKALQKSFWFYSGPDMYYCTKKCSPYK